MKSVFHRSLSKSSTTLLAFLTVIMLAPSVNAQREVPSGTGRPPGTGPVIMQPPGVREREFKIHEMEREMNKPRTPEEQQQALLQIGDDYQKIQVVNNKMLSNTMRTTTPDYASIVVALKEIKSRANRLTNNLRLQKQDDKETEKEPTYKKAEDVRGLKLNLLLLDKSIMSFVQNPIFKNPDVVNAKDATKASIDLETIVKLTDLIRKDADKLKEDSGKPD